VQCYADPAAFAERFPTSDERQQVILRMAEIRADVDRAMEACEPLLNLFLIEKPPEGPLPEEEE